MSALLSHADVLSKATAVIVVARYTKDGADTHYGLHALTEGSPHLRTVGLFTVEQANELGRQFFFNTDWHKRYLFLCPEVVYDYCRAHCIPFEWNRDATLDNVWVHAKDDDAFDKACLDWQDGEVNRLARLRMRTVSK